MWVKNGPYCVLMKKTKNKRFRQQVNPLTPISGLTLLVACPGNPMEELAELGGARGVGCSPLKYYVRIVSYAGNKDAALRLCAAPLRHSPRLPISVGSFATNSRSPLTQGVAVTLKIPAR